MLRKMSDQHILDDYLIYVWKVTGLQFKVQNSKKFNSISTTSLSDRDLGAKIDKNIMNKIKRNFNILRF